MPGLRCFLDVGTGPACSGRVLGLRRGRHRGNIGVEARPVKRTELKRKTPLRRTVGLARSSGLDRSGGIPKARKPIPAKSAKTAERDRYYARLRPVWMHEECAGAGVLDVHDGPAVDVHHLKGRGLRFMLDVSTWCALCRSCHHWVTTHPAGARAVGLLLREGDPVSNNPPYGRCRSCGRPIYWATVSTTGRSIPLIADPDTELPLAHDPTIGGAGRIQEMFRELTLGDVLTGISVRVLGKADKIDPELAVWRSHFTDCPHANEHRKSRA